MPYVCTSAHLANHCVITASLLDCLKGPKRVKGRGNARSKLICAMYRLKATVFIAVQPHLNAFSKACHSREGWNAQGMVLHSVVRTKTECDCWGVHFGNLQKLSDAVPMMFYVFLAKTGRQGQLNVMQCNWHFNSTFHVNSHYHFVYIYC